jgi:tRNA-splicing ligase RtcB
MSRTGAVKDAEARAGRGGSIEALISRELEAKGIIARAQSRRELAEEQPKAYKDVDHVVDVVEKVGLAKKVARLKTMGVIKG